MGLRTLWKVIVLVVLFSITIVFTAYAISAHHVASHIHEIEGHLMWSDFQGGSFFPWPSYPGGIKLPMLSLLSEVDVLYYQLFIKSWVLVGITVLLWVVTVVFLLFKIKKQRVLGKIPTRNKSVELRSQTVLYFGSNC